MVLMIQHRHCNTCEEPMPNARFGQRYCSQGCRAAGNAEEERAARRLWRAAGRPREYEAEAIDLAALGFVAAKPLQPVRRRRLGAQA
jgi:predicted nucleic acid-binding Zn ribbon protein